MLPLGLFTVQLTRADGFNLQHSYAKIYALIKIYNYRTQSSPIYHEIIKKQNLFFASNFAKLKI